MARAVCTEFRWRNGRNQDMQGVEFIPAGGAKAALLWHHGICEHSGRYTPVLQQIAEQGVAVYTFDAHGHGRSQPQEPDERCMISRFNDLVDDVYTFVSVLEQRHGSRLEPCVIGGQSMGALVVTHAVLRNQDRWAGLVLHSAAMGVVWTLVLRAQAAIGNILATVVPYAQMVPAVKPEDLHADPAVVEAFKSDPLVFHGNLRTRSANEVLKGMRSLEPRVPALTLPLYVVHGMRDKTTSFDAVDDLVRRVGSKDVTFNKVEDGYHELLMGEERTANGNAIAEWVKGRCSTFAAAAARAREERPASGKL
ncbi:alpha/beta fold family hydrolase [Monoraphidium neglectum]|uniref:Alpha/beta fold family hydrolase n=1 Tax=Monoraphidium neglectum TaxID=145388 RepID=A0A0D2MWE6_9CHLO|nr:alpha/beta fold family hydrolase [Monoraphidium neglectum]KIZ04797.1 alpha/beta fold family hydrolase [Monoraphidium neglectum]|eukprot:XP_013903816.1 alpha/beta fold family hydrolase [Monoraphidium neglectum]